MAVIAECYVRGVSTRRVDGLDKSLGIDGISKSQVSALAASLDEAVAAFRSRPLDNGPYTYLWLDALERAGAGGRPDRPAGGGARAGRERRRLPRDPGLELFTAEDGAGWTAFLRDLVARGLSGVRLVISDDHAGLVAAIAAVLPGASWQRCRTHFVRNLRTRVPKSAQPLVATLVRSIFAQPSATEVEAQHARVVGQLEARFPQAAALLEAAREDILAFRLLPPEHWRQIWSNNPLGAPEPGDPPAHRRGGHLPGPGGRHPARRVGARRAARGVGGRPPLHERGVACQGPPDRR